MSMKTNRSSSIIADDDDLEFLMDSHSSRILKTGDHVTGGTLNSGKPAPDCGRGKPYESCISKPNSDTKPPENPGIYNRGRCANFTANNLAKAGINSTMPLVWRAYGWFFLSNLSLC
ncbi:hypothetical protein V6N13_112509 [Hibiscus sabdariffa]